ncbi:hypothetical protein KVR01_009514 [Diaporthe batatas]|uniref:uncharacterized protein n=1 Tax=Diaporthe batatas TaxID=748121 RepID=UPI001D03D8B4|nr:uncharacterized protein KVR01_009514 [Diaporthe batatas]KAG8161250.1 hypothetical protein KVR01_009514 [Diaporthe batatas]
MSNNLTTASTGGRNCQFRTYHTSPKKGGGLVTELKTEPFARLQDDTDGQYALVIRRKFTDRQELESTTLRVNSPHLLGVFRDVVGSGYTTVASDFKSPFDLTAPFQILLHYWDELEQVCKTTEDKEVRQHLRLLFDFMSNEMGPERDNVLRMISKGQISYLQAWVLFRPGDLVYTSLMGHPWLLRCHKTAYEESTVAGPYIVVTCSYTDHDGTLEGSATHKFVIHQKRWFGSENPAFITDLPVYPRRLVRGEDDLEGLLEERGRKFLARKAVCTQAYDGIAQYLKEPPDSFFDPDMASFEGVWLPFTETGRVILDRKTFHDDQYGNQVPIKVQKPDPLLCPPYAYGYSLSRKDWCRFFVDRMDDVKWKQGVWDSLILAPEQKRVLQALVTSHEFPDNARNEAEQKGKGLVVLLHGTPGSGKTLTAETAAEGAQKALISASLGELNRYNSARAFEILLKQVLTYATMWKAVVLLDEADVFLEARQESLGDGSRNALVAVFLKELEYFSGIVFLTTNRIETFDQAMKSRIHLALEYSPPDIEIRRQVWMKLLGDVPKDVMGIEDVDDAVENILMEKLNGREISNALNTARTLARFEQEKLGLNHIERVLQVRHDFDKSIQRKARQMTSKLTDLSTSATGGLVRQSSIGMADIEEYKS